MWCWLTHHDVPPSTDSWWSLVLYLVACSSPNITSQFFDRGKNSMRCENPETQLSAGLVLKDPYLCMLGKNKAAFEVWIKWEFSGLHQRKLLVVAGTNRFLCHVALIFYSSKMSSSMKVVCKAFQHDISTLKWTTQNIFFHCKKGEVGTEIQEQSMIFCVHWERRKGLIWPNFLSIMNLFAFKPLMSCANKDLFTSFILRNKQNLL